MINKIKDEFKLISLETDKPFPSPLEFAVRISERLKDIEKVIATTDDEAVVKLWDLLKQRHILNTYNWAKQNNKTDMVLKIENDVIKTLTDDGAELEIMFVSKGVK